MGCGRGDLAAALVDRGWAVTGSRAVGRRLRGWPAAAAWTSGGARSGRCQLEPGPYDLRGVPALARARDRTRWPTCEAWPRAPRPGGCRVDHGAQLRLLAGRRFGSRWFHLDLPRHRVHFTETGCGARLMRPVSSRSASHHAQLDRPAGQHPVRAAGRCLFPDGLKLRVAAGLCSLAYPISRVVDRSRARRSSSRGGAPARAPERIAARSPAPSPGRALDRCSDFVPVGLAHPPSAPWRTAGAPRGIRSESSGGTVTPVPVSSTIRAASLPLASARIGRPALRYSKSLPVASPR